MENDNDNILYELDDVQSEGFSLESILAEYKGSAFINGDKKTPSDKLNEEAERIVKEESGRQALIKEAVILERNEPDAVLGALDFTPAPVVITDAEPQTWLNPFNDETRRLSADNAIKQGLDQKEKDILFIENYRNSMIIDQDSLVQDVEKAIERELDYGDHSGTSASNVIDFFTKTRKFEVETAFEEESFEFEEEVFEEPDLRDAVKKFAEECNSISLRSIPAAIITIVMVILTFAYEAGMIIPFGIGRVQPAAIGALIIGLLLVMILCSDIVLRGTLCLARGAPNAETLILFSCAFSIISGVFTILRGSPAVLTYCAVSALSLTFAAFGEKYNLRAITDTLKTATGSSEPYGLLADYNSDIDKSVLKKASRRIDGFYNNLMRPDVAESFFRYATPLLLAVALILSVLTAVAKGQGEYFLHILSSLLAAAAPFSALMAFSVPFTAVSRSIRKSGASIAGWGGADEICFSDGACVTDEDLFPPGTLSFNGIKLYEGVSPEKAIKYTASLIVASGSGLSRIYSEVLKTLGLSEIKVEDFACYEGGIGALLHGERVMSGSAAYMNLLGIRVPDDMNMKNAVYTSINDKLVAMFVIDYMPVSSVQSALISILKWRIKLFFAVRDFNVTPLMLEQKFKVSLEDVEYTQARDSYSISDLNTGKEGRVAAVLTREGLGPFADAVTGGRLLKSAAFVSTLISIFSAFLGVLMMFYISWSGAFLSSRPGNLMLFMLSMLGAMLVVSGYARCKR